MGQITDTKRSKLPVRQRNLSPRENKEQRQETPSSNPLKEDNAVQAYASTNLKSIDKKVKKELLKKPEEKEQSKWKLKSGESEEIENKESSAKKLEKIKQTHWVKFKNNAIIKNNIVKG